MQNHGNQVSLLSKFEGRSESEAWTNEEASINPTKRRLDPYTTDWPIGSVSGGQNPFQFNGTESFPAGNLFFQENVQNNVELIEINVQTNGSVFRHRLVLNKQS